MKDIVLKLYVYLQALKASEEGQDLVEYALIVSLIAFAAIIGMNGLATGINTAFLGISSKLTSATGTQH